MWNLAVKVKPTSSMGAGVSAPYATSQEALAAGKTQSEIDEWIATNKPEDAVAASSAAANDSKPATETATVKLDQPSPFSPPTIGDRHTLY